jgi:hypothetical protein
LVLHDSDACLMFDRNKDPLEMHNLYYRPEHAATVRRLRSKIEEFQRRNSDKKPLPERAVRRPLHRAPESFLEPNRRRLTAGRTLCPFY